MIFPIDKKNIKYLIICPKQVKNNKKQLNEKLEHEDVLNADAKCSKEL